MRQPEWRAVKGYEGLYLISEYGEVKSQERIDYRGARRKEKILKHCVGTNGYPKVSLSREGRLKQISVHRLVALAFLPASHAALHVNHKDGDKLNSHFSNLEWCTIQENNQHAFRTGLNVPKTGKGGKGFKGTIIATNIKTGCEIEINGSLEMARLGFDDTHVYMCANGRQRIHKGHTFRRVEDGNT